MLIKKFLKVIVASIALLIAIAGFLIPILPGWPFLLAAFVIFSPDNGKGALTKIKNFCSRYRKKQ